MQSQKRGKPEAHIPLPLPWGFGSMAFKGRVWQLTWRDPAGKIHWESSGTADAAEAQRIMADRALPRARAMVDQLMRIANGEETYQAPKSTGGGGRPRKGRAPVPSHPGAGRGKREGRS